MPFPKANRRVRFWRRRWRKAKPGTPARARAYHMLKRRKADLARLLRRHATGHVSSRGLALIAVFEGFRSRPYQDVVGVWTIGYGETHGIGPRTPPWSQSYARARLRTRVDHDYLAPVLATAKAAGVKLKQHEADAIASLVYNCGPGILAKGRTMGEAIRSGNRARMRAAFLAYVYAGGKVWPGLVRRRRAEQALFGGH